ncbi:MAG: Cys-tRNA(Pro) deacylase [Clostridia bacterium]|nr:Cys-tRNA(Pro) deacylase [Clostridia bacterium]
MEYKTNVMRILDRAGAKYTPHSYVGSGAVSGACAAAAMKKDPAGVFKTLVTVGKSKKHYVFVIPVREELDLKRAAASVGEKSVEMIKQKELLPLTGYIHGGCSPIGMKKFFKTTLHESAKDLETITFSAGKIGYMVEMSAEELKKVIEYGFADITVSAE